MTYYEWVTYIENLTNKRINDDVINKINQYEFDYPQNVMIRLTDHIINVIYKKLNNERNLLNDKLYDIKSPNELTLLINNLKSVIADTLKLLKVKYFDNSLITDIKNDIYNDSNDYIDIIKKHYNGITSNEYAIIINNLKLMEEK